ncbi:uncharacterized protein STEHIDRAFT_110641 [Stereum hirsutum FP-91666 SS1]|uniref:uncharacterized protein n=1 Tax=Stereum hirsutum (strain FP-91666) TaxID=721885 RepID=UPI000440DAE0|nr:uncharacterized protein STEHIDRAFT_110641 [Stereum hirsutum FP-91666 SS1]EIM87423.1 hypothetical protein STEHIDRAFT_110641 [Stereum hirsutum FP-91666 SS1]
MASYQYERPDLNWPHRQNFIQDADLPDPDKLEFQYSPSYPCPAEMVQNIHLAIELLYLRNDFWNDLQLVVYNLGQIVKVRRVFYDQNSSQNVFGPWVVGQVTRSGLQDSILGLSAAWYEVQWQPAPNTFDSMIVFPGLGETWDNSPYTVPRITADQAMDMMKALTEVIVPELVRDRTRDEWHWEWTPATVVSSLEDPNIQVFFQGDTAAAKRHNHTVRETPLTSTADAHVISRVPLGNEVYLRHVQEQGQFRPPTRESQPLLPQSPAIHVIWVAPMTRESCSGATGIHQMGSSVEAIVKELCMGRLREVSEVGTGLGPVLYGLLF